MEECGSVATSQKDLDNLMKTTTYSEFRQDNRIGRDKTKRNKVAQRPPGTATVRSNQGASRRSPNRKRQTGRTNKAKDFTDTKRQNERQRPPASVRAKRLYPAIARKIAELDSKPLETKRTDASMDDDEGDTPVDTTLFWLLLGTVLGESKHKDST